LSKPKRKLRNFLLFPGAQLRHGFWFVGVTTFFHIVLSLVSIILVDAWLSGKKGVGALPFWQIIAVIIVLYIGFLVFAFLFGLYISHKWLGPMFAIEKYAGTLARGEPASPLILRKNALPQLQDLANSLNALAERAGSAAKLPETKIKAAKEDQG
jgi:hypothetical protein